MFKWYVIIWILDSHLNAEQNNYVNNGDAAHNILLHQHLHTQCCQDPLTRVDPVKKEGQAKASVKKGHVDGIEA